MNLKQLRYIAAIVEQNFNLSRAAEALHTTQPGVSAQLGQLEDELGVKVFERKGKRLLGLTPAGESIFSIGQEVLLKIENIHSVSADFQGEKKGTFTIATTHTQARYALPTVISRFLKRYPQVQLRIRQGYPNQISEMVIRGEADVVIATEAIASYDELLVLPVYRWNRCVIAPPKHPIHLIKKIALKDIAQYPLVTYDFAFTGRTAMNQAFQSKGLQANIALTAIDSDVIKHYVELGLGIGILARMAFDEKQDKALRARDVSHLFEDSVTSIGIRKGSYLRAYMLEFIELFAPHLPVARVQQALQHEDHALQDLLLQDMNTLELR